MTDSIIQKTCLKCNQSLPASNFNKNKTKKDGLQTFCKKCQKGWYETPENKSRVLARVGKTSRENWHKKTPVEKYAVNLKRFFKMSIEDYKHLYIAQNGKCGICQTSEEMFSLVVDHDHQTNKIRGLLCSKCNSAIGMLGDSAETVRRAVDYLEGN